MIPLSKLSGKRVLVTRPRYQAAETIEKLRKAGAKVIHIPLIEIADPSDNFRSLDRAISRLDQYDWIIFTSQNAVTKFFERITQPLTPKGRGRRLTSPLPWRERVRVRGNIAAVGPATAAALRAHGVKKIIVPKKGNYNSEGLIHVLKRYKFKDKRVLFPCARKSHETLPLWLKKQCTKLDKVEAYQTIMPKHIDRTRFRNLITGNKIDAVLFYSTSAERNFNKLAKPNCVVCRFTPRFQG